jgi:hypothetical protein
MPARVTTIVAPLDCPAAHEQLCADVFVTGARGNQPRDPQLLGGQIVDCAGVALACGLARRAQLVAGARGPQRASEALERKQTVALPS